jgi:hypothetical protein
MKKPLLILALLPSIATGDPVFLIRDHATPYERPAMVPEASDVTMRTLRFRPRDRNDPQDTFRAIDAFHATRLEWSYLNSLRPMSYVSTGSAGRGMTLSDRRAELEKIARVQAGGRIFGSGSGSTIGVFELWDMEHGNHVKMHTMLGIDGEPVILGHAAAWSRPPSPGCMNNPAYREAHLTYLKANLDAGATTIQRDEPSVQFSFAASGQGCYCSFCMEGFRDYLNKNVPPQALESMGVADPGTFDYGRYLSGMDSPPARRAFDWSDPATIESFKAPTGSLHDHFVRFQLDTTMEFFRWIRRELTAYNDGVPVGYTANNTSFQNWEAPYFSLFDFCISEMMLQSANPGHIYERAQKARSLGKMQVFGTPKTMGADYDEEELVRLKQQVIATAYASGALASVPWDVFMQSVDGGERYFGKPEEFAPLFAMVRASHRYLDGYCTAGAAGLNIRDDRYGEQFPVLTGDPSGGLCVFLRAVPGDAEAPVVVHLVDWGERRDGPVTLRLRRDAFFPDTPLTVTLREPLAHDAQAHLAAERRAQAMRAPGERLGPAQSGAYEELVRQWHPTVAVDGEYTVVQLETVQPWTMLIVRGADR